QGVSIFVSRGWHGGDTCELGPADVGELWSAARAGALGGSRGNTGFTVCGNDGGSVPEAVWNDVSGATGGGVSQVFAKPAFQNVSGGPSGTMRTVPDIAMMASPNTPGVLIYDDGDCGGGGACGTDVATLSQIGGTSLSAPVWSGISKLIMQKSGSRLGNPDSKIYSLASSSQSGNGFRDVTTGNNSFNAGAGLVSGYSAATGYDEVTGWGTVDMNTFVTAFAAASSGGTPTPTATATATATATPTPTPTATPTPTVSAAL